MGQFVPQQESNGGMCESNDLRSSHVKLSFDFYVVGGNEAVAATGCPYIPPIFVTFSKQKHQFPLHHLNTVAFVAVDSPHLRYATLFD